MWANGLLLLALALAQSQTEVRSEEHGNATVINECYPRTPLKKLNYQPDRHMQIFTDFEFACSGEIAAWNFYAGKEGHFYASVWRKHQDGRFEMVGKNFVKAQKKGEQNHFIPKHLRFKVRSSDVLGIHYEDDSGHSVITFEDDFHGNNPKASIRLSATVGKDRTYNDKLKVGYVLKNKENFLRKGKRAPSLVPVLNKGRLRLDGGHNALEGRAMFLTNGVWGSICDDHVKVTGWPSVFCRELGFDHAEEVKLASQVYVGVSTGDIGMKNPACNKDNTRFMEECHRQTRPCNHTLDMYVRCAYGVKLIDGKSPREGRAMAYNERWGTICDRSQSRHGWPSALCHEMGMNHARNVKKATDTYAGKGSGHITYTNPTCENKKPYHLSSCVKNGQSCQHNNDIFIKCQAGVRLIGGRTPDEGIAQVYHDGNWGTVCMDVISRDRFPTVFCQNLGYDRAATVKHAKTAYTGKGSGRITEKNPDCSPVDAANVWNCGHPEEKDCGHGKDIFIKCAYNDMCQGEPCQNGAICISMQNDYRCECTPGYSGPNCENDIDDCDSTPCLNGGTCVDKVNGFQCLCGVKHSGPLCQYMAVPKDPVTISSFDEPNKKMYSAPTDKKQERVSLSTFSTPFKLVPGLVNKPGAVSFKALKIGSFYLRVNENNLDLEEAYALDKKNFDEDASFYLEENSEHQGNYIIQSYRDTSKVLAHVSHDRLRMKAFQNNTHFIKTALFSLYDLDSQNTLSMYSAEHFTGKKVVLTQEQHDLRDRDFDDMLSSFKISGTSAWQLFEFSDFGGKSAIAQPGKYDIDWINTHIGKKSVSSVRKVGVTDGITLWEKDGFSGHHLSLSDSMKNVAHRSYLGSIESVEVSGPSSWELYSKKKYEGEKKVVTPGRFSAEWLNKTLEGKTIKSVRKVEINSDKCDVHRGEQEMKGRSGEKHSVFTVHRQDGSVWLRFGEGNMNDTWKYMNDAFSHFKADILSKKDIAAIKDFEFIGWEVDTDVKLKMSVDNSWHPSSMEVMYLGSKFQEKMKFKNTFSDRTDITFGADKSQLVCTGRVKNGKALPNLCGQKGLPMYGTLTNNLVITSVNMKPRGQRAYAHNKEFSRNAFDWQGSYYYVYAKLATCTRSTGCFKRQSRVNLVMDKVKAKQEDRPKTFYFGQLDKDVDACEDACRDAEGCEAFTLFKKGGDEFKKGCYGVGKDNLGEGVNQAGTVSGQAMECGSFVPEYMKDDMWTKNSTGCPCKFDPSQTDCACCHEGACQCERRHKYQCTLCGFSERCGSPFVTSSSGEYLFEYTNQQISEAGRHYEIPGLCVSGCEMVVRGTDSAASRVAAYMTDVNDNRVLSCVADNLADTDDVAVEVMGGTTGQGASVSRINLYASGGVGELVQLKLKMNKEACPKVTKDARYLGCFARDHSKEYKNLTRDVPTLTSTHMTKGLCIKHCHKKGSTFAMLHMGTTCMCVDETPASGAAYNCDQFCSGNSQQICGGKTSLSVFRTKHRKFALFMVAVPGGCPALKATFLSSVNISTTPESCQDLTGAAPGNETGLVPCTLDICGSNSMGTGGMFMARPGSCGDRKRGENYVKTTGTDCMAMGGVPEYPQTSWGHCKLDLCTSDIPRDTIYNQVSIQSCPSSRRLGRVLRESTAGSCRKLGGELQDTSIPEANMTECKFEICTLDSNPMLENIFSFPHNNQMIEANAKSDYDLPEMCVTECQMNIEATSEGESIAEATLLDGNDNEVGLYCKGVAANFSKSSTLSFPDKATGVKVSAIRISANNNSFVLSSLRLRTDPSGCKEDTNMVVLYDQANFGGRPLVIKDDIVDLATVDFNNKASSFKIYGDYMWELFENQNMKGTSAVLSAGEFYDTSVLPFGDNELSSIKRGETISANMDQTRKDKSNARGIVCFKRTLKSSAVFGLPPNTPLREARPRVYFFGNFGNNIDKCERACRDEPQCAAFTLFSTAAGAGLKDWRGLCYGRSFRDEVQVYQEDVMSGYVASCKEEDTITFYTEKEFAGLSSTIIEDLTNITFSSGPFSAMVTGKDSWRVRTESKGHIHTYNLSPGDYADLSATFAGTVFQVSKMHPNTQLYKAQHNKVDLAPVAFNQISKTITKIKTKVGGVEPTITKKVCNTTEKAEIFFVLDASSSIFDYNYVKILKFMTDVVDSFAISASKVRVGVIIFSYHTHLDITLGQYNDKDALLSAIKKLTYYRGGTYTDKALKVLREEGLSDAIVRPGVSKQGIVLTDGRSRHVSKTAEQARLCRDAGIVLTAVGIKGANYEELHNIAGDASRVYNVTDFDKLSDILGDLKQTTCTAVEQGNIIYNVSEHITITVQGDDSNYFIHEDTEFKRKPVALGMESGVIYDSQIFASSSLINYGAHHGRLNHNSGWMTTGGNNTKTNEWIEIDLGKIIPIHGIASQGHAVKTAWVTKYKIAISLDGIHFVTFKDTNTSTDLIFIGNSDQGTIKYHCLHRLFGQAIMARVIRFIVVEWHISISMRIELYGFRDPDDSQLLETLRKDVWTRNVTGCPCYYNPALKDCACCEDGGCQCPSSDRHQCVQCGYPHTCGTPSLRNPVNNIDGWTSSLSGCRCAFDPLRTDCACCQHYGCQCGYGNKNQCVNCGHPEHCGLKEHIFGPNPYCKPQTCPKKVSTIWEGPGPSGINPGNTNPIVQEEEAQPIVVE